MTTANPPRKPPVFRESEDDFKAWVLDVARLHGWRLAHFRPALTGRGWRTPMEGDPGFPDLVLSRAGRKTLFVELKTATGKPTPAQVRWLELLGGEIWRPADRDHILEVLR